MGVFDIAAVLIGLSAFFGYLNYQFLKLPNTIGLVLIAVFASLSVILIDLLIPSAHIGATVIGILNEIDFYEAVMHGMLSFLLFAGALHVDFSAFSDRRWAIATMATLGTVLSTFVVGGIIWLLFGAFSVDMPFIWALVFGALISPTDPVAVLGLFKTVKVPDTLEAKIAGESLFNDGVGVVIFTVLLALAMGADAHGDHLGAADVAELFVREVVGGAVLGLVAGYVGYRAMHKVDDYNLEILISLAMVMVGYSVAIHLHMSGPIAMVVAGLILGNKGVDYAMSEITREYLLKFWSLFDEVLNSVLFLLIGLEVLVLADGIEHWEIALLAIPVTLLGRTTAVSVTYLIVKPWESFTRGALPVLIWGGLRGGIAVALALSLPNNEFKPTILSLTYVVVLFSIIVQGLTVKALVEKVVHE